MGLADALALGTQQLAQIPPETVCKTSGARYEGGDYILQWFNNEKPLSAVSEPLRILWLHYLTANGTQNLSGNLIAYRDVAPALFYEPNFHKRAVKPLISCFGKNPEKLIETGEFLGGKKADLGDASVTINVLPYLPLTFVIWAGSEEFPPDGNILFDKTVKSWFSSEDVVVFASMAVYEMIGTFKKRQK